MWRPFLIPTVTGCVSQHLDVIKDGTREAWDFYSGKRSRHETLAKHFDFRDEKGMIERMLVERAHIPCFLSKFHPELNPIERVWAQLKR